MPRPPLTPEQLAEGRRLAAEIRKAREQRNREQADLARGSGVSVDAIRALEANRVTAPSFLTVARLARELGLPLDDLAARALGRP